MGSNAIEKIIINQIKNDELAIFAGAGMSIGAGYVSWKELLRDIAEEINLEVDKESDLVSVAQYHYNKYSRNKLDQKILNEFSNVANENPLVNVICKLPIRTIWTTNYDKLIEDTYKKFNKSVHVKVTNQQLAISLHNKDCELFKIHGDKDDPSNAVITRDDYETFFRQKSLFVNRLISDLLSKTFVFIGYSFGDPNFEHVLSTIRYDLMGKSRVHYCFQRKVSKDDFDSEDEFNYANIKQELKIEDLKKYNIYTILVDQYDDITTIFSNVLFELTKKNIFVSGAADIYDDFGTDKEAKKFITTIAYELTKKEYSIISGYGLGVGGYVNDGIIRSINENDLPMHDQYIIRPFPQGINQEEDKKSFWTNHRRNLISKSSVSIFLFGNKIVEGEIKLSNGMKEEFEISREMGNIIIPIASTGYMSKEIYKTIIRTDIPDYIKKLISDLSSEKNPHHVVSMINDIIDIHKKQ